MQRHEVSRDDLVGLYVEQQLSFAEMSRRLGVSIGTVSNWLRAAGIPARDRSTAARLRKGKYTFTPEHRAKLADSLVKARSAITPETHAKQSVTMKGREPPNKGGSWDEAIHAKHGYRQTDEYREAAAERQRGEKSPLWRGGYLDEIDQRLRTWEWRQRRRECYERDLWLCQDCAVHCSSRGKTKIQAHHLVARRNGGSDDLGNLVTLCMSCHMRREHGYGREAPIEKGSE